MDRLITFKKKNGHACDLLTTRTHARRENSPLEPVFSSGSRRAVNGNEYRASTANLDWPIR